MNSSMGAQEPLSLRKNINDFTILIDCSPQKVLLAVDLPR
jgi:hypothetical protein